MKYNKNENVKLVINAKFANRETMDFVAKAATEAVLKGEALPEDLRNLFTLEIVTRPSGSRYGVLDFA